MNCKKQMGHTRTSRVSLRETTQETNWLMIPKAETILRTVDTCPGTITHRSSLPPRGQLGDERGNHFDGRLLTRKAPIHLQQEIIQQLLQAGPLGKRVEG